jgi:MFS family permease
MSEPESPYAWARLAVSLLLMTIGGSGMYVVAVVLPELQADFGVDRAAASLPYTLTMIGFGLGGVLMGRLADRFGVMPPILGSALALSLGYALAGMSQSLGQFCIAQALLIGLLGSSATFAPLVADISLWFTRHRGIAVAICISGNYLAGAIWPPLAQYFIDRVGWRPTYLGIGAFSVASITLLALFLRPRAPLAQAAAPAGPADLHAQPLGLSPNTLLALLCLAGLACCVAMSMPLVHIVAYCGDLGIAAARGAEMLSLMMGFGIVSRLASGWIADRIGGLRTLLLGSTLQALALALFVPADGLMSLYAVSVLFGIFQGGVVPSYAIIVREYFPPQQAGSRLGIVLMATLFGMALGGWMSGALFDLSGSYRAAFVNGIVWNALNIVIIAWLLLRARGSPEPVAPARLPV